MLDDLSISLYPQAWAAAGTDEVFIGRIRQDASHSKGIAMWVVADNLRKGAALNAVQIAEGLAKRNWLKPGIQENTGAGIPPASSPMHTGQAGQVKPARTGSAA